MDLSALIKFRESLGFNQKDFAEQLGVKQTTYNGYEKGKSDPGIDFLIKIAQKYNVSLDFLLGLSDVQRPYGTEKEQGSEYEPLLSKEDIQFIEFAKNLSPQKRQALIELLK